jgi:membrane-associated phospholipid phosphatase
MWTAHERLRWRIILGVAAFNIAALLIFRISIEGSNLAYAAGFLGFLAFGLFYRFVRPMERVAVTVIALSQIAAFAVSLALASYMALNLDRPMIDGALFNIDQSLGFDWKTVFQRCMSIPAIKSLLIAAYNSTQVQIILLAAVLGLAGQTERLDKFLLSFVIGGVTTVSLWALFPSFGAATFLYSTGATSGLPHLDIVYNFVKPQMALQSGHMTGINLTELKGVVGAPSFHTVMALVTVRAVAGLGKWFWPVAAWNVFVVASVPVFGGHHLSDVLAGAAVAAFAIYAAERLAAHIGSKAGHSAIVPLRKIVAAE